MRRAGIRVCSALLTLILLLSLTPVSFAGDEGPNYYDCVILLYSFDSAGNSVSWSTGVLVSAGDGSGDVWAVASYTVTSGAAQYVAVDPSDIDQTTTAKCIAGTPESGVAIFRLDNRLPSRTVPTMATLDGLAAGDMVTVTSIAEEPSDDSLYFFSRSAYLQELTTSNDYTFFRLGDGKYPLSELSIYTVGAVMTDTGRTIGFYVGDHLALPCAYIMVGETSIGSYDEGGQDSAPPPEEDGGEEPPPADGGQQEPGSTLTTVPSASGVDELLEQAEASRARTGLLQIALVAGAVVVAAGLILFAILRSRKVRNAPPPAPVPPPNIIGKTEHMDGGRAQTPRFRVTPLNGTPGQPREIPPQGLVFGRSPSCDVTFPPETGGVSGTHCSLTFQNGALCLTDLGSSFGTLLEDGRKLSGESAALSAGGCFYLGSRKIGFRVDAL